MDQHLSTVYWLYAEQEGLPGLQLASQLLLGRDWGYSTVYQGPSYSKRTIPN